jgi:selenide,water dikinase
LSDSRGDSDHNTAHHNPNRITPMTDLTQIQSAPRLTSLSHGGGCGCKIAPGVLADLLRRTVPMPAFPDLLVGNDTADDAAVYRINDEQAIVATTDFFMPIVDDPFDFGRIAATNALSDVYAMGGKPILALALVGMPINVLPHEVIAAILKGGESARTRASPSRVAIRSIRSSRSTASRRWDSCTPAA